MSEEIIKKKKRGRPRSSPFGINRDEMLARKRRNQAVSKALLSQRREGIGGIAEVVAEFPGGMGAFLPYVYACEMRDRGLAPLVNAMQDLHPSKQTPYKLEELCNELSIAPGYVLELIVRILWENKQNVARAIASLAMPKVASYNVQRALQEDGVEDRRMFMLSTGMLPTPKGSTINVSNLAQAGVKTNEGEPTGLTPFEESTMTFSEVIRQAAEQRVKALPEPDLESVAQDEE